MTFIFFNNYAIQLRRPDSSPAVAENSATLQQEVAALELKDVELSQQIDSLISQWVQLVLYPSFFSVHVWHCTYYLFIFCMPDKFTCVFMYLIGIPRRKLSSEQKADVAAWHIYRLQCISACPRTDRVEQLTALGVVINDQMTAADHVSKLLEMCLRRPYVLRVLC